MSETTVQTGTDTGATGQSGDWLSGVDENIRNDPSLAGIGDLNALAKSYVHAQRMVGRDKIVIPKDGADQGEWDDFYNRLGRPQEYSFDQGQLPDGLDYDADMEASMKKIMHAAGLTQRQAAAVYNGYMEYTLDKHQTASNDDQTTQAGWYEQLQKEFGKAFDESIDLSQRAALEYGGQEFLTWLDQSGMGNHPMMVKMFAAIGKQMSEGKIEGDSSRNDFALTPAAAEREINRLNQDENFMKRYLSSDQPGHKEAVEQMQKLFAFAHPE